MASDNSLVTPEYRLYPYQRQVYRDILAALNMPERRVVAHLPTGAGKTRVASHIACHMLNARDEKNALVIWLASTEELCEQATEALERAWSHLGLREVTVNRYWGEHQQDLENLPGGFLVAGLSKLWGVARRDSMWSPRLAKRAAGVVFDEAHQAVAPTHAFLTEQLIGAATPLLGLTATPGRQTTLGDEDYALAEIFARRRVSIDPQGHDNAVTYLIAGGYLSEPRFVTKEFPGDGAPIEGTTESDYSKEILDKLGQDETRNRKIVEWATEAIARHRRVIAFCPTVESAHKCEKLLRASGIDASAITAETPQEIRSDIIGRYRENSVYGRIILNYGVLTAGFDAPKTSCVIVARPTKSLVLYSQMVGRALRGPNVGGTRWAEIVTVVDINLPGFGSVTDAFKNWEELWSTHH